MRTSAHTAPATPADVTNVGRWNAWYGVGLDEPQPYGDTLTYEVGAAWLADCAMVEDWGAGKGWLRTLIPPERYRGIDGSATPFADTIADLAFYRSRVPGVFIRHVLEHDPRWSAILGNALASATERMFLAVFTPLAAKTGPIAYNDHIGVPDIAFALDDLTAPIAAAGFAWTLETLPTATQYGAETVLRCER